MNILYKARSIYFFLAIISIFVGGFFVLQKIQDFHLEAHAETAVVSKRENEISMLFLGDAMFDRNVRVLLEKKGFDYPFVRLDNFVKQFDLAVLNLEGVYTDYESISAKNREILRFTFDPKGIQVLKDSGFDIVSQANNHTADFGRDGATLSKHYLEYEGVKVVGDYFNETDPLLLNVKHNEIALVAFNEFSYNRLEEVLSSVSKLKAEGKTVIVFAHFGIEYERFASDNQKEFAHSFIDSGADIVIGAHPHVVQAIESYKGKPIIYSLGNFVFDQYFSKETQESIGVVFYKKGATLSFQIIPFKSEASQSFLMSSDDAKVLLEGLSHDSQIPDDWKEMIRTGKRISIN